jgi:hypothetical protein
MQGGREGVCTTYDDTGSPYNPVHIHNDNFHHHESDIHHCVDMGWVNTGRNLKQTINELKLI